MTTSAFLFKWFWYTMAVLPVWLLEDLVFSHVSLLGVSPLLLPLTVVAGAVLEGSAAGAGFGLGIGLWWAAALPGVRSSIIITTTLMGLVSGLIAQYRLKQSYIGCLFCSALSLSIITLLRIAKYFFGGTASLPALLRIAAPELVISLLFVAPVYLLFRLVYQRVGGSKLA